MDNCWKNKNENAKRAAAHAERMEKDFSAEIGQCVGATSYHECNKPELSGGVQQIVVADMDSVTAAIRYRSGRTAILNFASYKDPGGRFLDGSMAQEEALCHESILYNVLKRFEKSYYEKNREQKNRALYLNRALYSENILFLSDEGEYRFDVITCASPNYSAAEKYCHVTREENHRVLESRIRFVLSLAENADKEIDTLILGAFGCGVFGQDPTEVAEIFRDNIGKTRIGKIVFAIPGGPNLEAFRKVFGTSETEDEEVYNGPQSNGGV